jgi:hypothetical protein
VLYRGICQDRLSRTTSVPCQTHSMSWIQTQTKTLLLRQILVCIAGLKPGHDRNAVRLSPLFLYGKVRVTEAIPPIVH